MGHALAYHPLRIRIYRDGHGAGGNYFTAYNDVQFISPKPLTELINEGA
jgi:hypothetical protein